MVTPFEYFNNKLGVQAKFLIMGEHAHPNSLKLISERALQLRIEKDVVKRLRQRGPGTPMLVLWDSIECWQKILVAAFGEPKEQSRVSLFEKTFVQDTAAMAFYSAFMLERNGKKSYLNNDAIEDYTLNASVLNTLAKYHKSMVDIRKALRGETISAWMAAVNDCNRFRDVKPHTLPEHADNLRKKLKAYKADGYAALISGKLANNNARVVTTDVEAFLNNLFAGQSNKPTYTDVAKQYESFTNGYLEVINNETGEVYQPKDLPAISKSSILNYLAKWQNEIGTEAVRSGDRQKLMQKFKPYHSLSQAKYAGSIISIDDRQPPFEYAPGKRMWFYNAIDLGSEAFTTWVHGETKEGIIIDFYRQMVRNYADWGFHLPAELEGESSLNSSFVDTFLQPGAMFQHVRIEANNARGKRIEAYYRPLRYNIEKKREGWLARPFAQSEANQKGAAPVPCLPKSTIIDGCLRDIETWNNMPHSKIQGKTRWEVFTECQNPSLQPTNYRSVLKNLGYCTKTSCNAGIIKLNNKEFLLGDAGHVYTGEKLIRLMKEVEGQTITIYWLDNNDGEVLKAHIYLDNLLICEAIAKPVYNRATIEQTPTDLKNREIMSAYVATIEGYMKNRKGKLEGITIIDNTPAATNNKFQIKGIKHFQATPIETPEILQQLTGGEEPMLKPAQISKKSLIDRF